MYGIMFVALRSSHANSLAFGNAVQTAVLPENTKNDPGIQRIIAVTIVGITCLAHAHSRNHYIAISNLTAPLKFLVLIFIVILGLLAYGGVQSETGRRAYPTQYGKENLKDAFKGTSTHSYFWGMGLLMVSRSFSGYENANLVSIKTRFTCFCVADMF
jgi:amino acid transporter